MVLPSNVHPISQEGTKVLDISLFSVQKPPCNSISHHAVNCYSACLYCVPSVMTCHTIASCTQMQQSFYKCPRDSNSFYPQIISSLLPCLLLCHPIMNNCSCSCKYDENQGHFGFYSVLRVLQAFMFNRAYG